MKNKTKIFVTAVALAAAFICGACTGTTEAHTHTVSAAENSIDDSWVDGFWQVDGDIIIDPETGVHYICLVSFNGSGKGIGITPRFNADGTLYTGE